MVAAIVAACVVAATDDACLRRSRLTLQHVRSDCAGDVRANGGSCRADAELAAHAATDGEEKVLH